MDIAAQLTAEFSLSRARVDNIIELIDSGCTIPFIARYRKEMTGSCDDQVLRELFERLTYLRSLEKRRQEITESIASQGKLTDELVSSLDSAKTLAEIEDIYRPFKPKRRTRGSIAREKGLEPLAQALLCEKKKKAAELAEGFINPEKGVETVDDAIQGAKDIVAEDISDNALLRSRLRGLYQRYAAIEASAASDADSVYSMYYDYSEPVAKIPGHRILAINRGEREGYLDVYVELETEIAINAIRSQFVKPELANADLLEEAAADSWKRLLQPSVEREVRAALTEKASEQAVKMFALNLKPLLLQPPVKGCVTMGFDPAYRTGCKIAVVDETGKLLEYTVVFPTPPQNRVAEAKEELLALIKKYNVKVISIGNGTASKESEIFVSELVKSAKGVKYMVVNESGASVYSASKLAAEEFPNIDVSYRSAASIARRLQDPLAELVKIDPKSIGVGQYQHDVAPAMLDEALGGVVEDCVNSVGVDLNTASASLLTFISGLNASVAKNIVSYRDENGGFKSRAELKKVPRLGPKAFEQCAGFLRIAGSANVLDNTSVHPESYAAAKELIKRLGLSLPELAGASDAAVKQRVETLGEDALADSCGVGVPTLRDIIKELQKPGRDPRDELPKPMLRADVLDMNDLKPGMELKGTVRNVVDFGVFIDIGVHQDGLAHISQLSARRVNHPSEVVSVGDIVTVYVLGVDAVKKRISLSLLPPASARAVKANVDKQRK